MPSYVPSPPQFRQCVYMPKPSPSGLKFSSNETSINYKKQTVVEDVLQNVRMILGTYKTTVPLSRDFAMDISLIDKRVPDVRNEIAAILLDVLKKYEPRAKLKSVEIKNVNDSYEDYEIILYLEVMAKW